MRRPCFGVVVLRMAARVRCQQRRLAPTSFLNLPAPWRPMRQRYERLKRGRQMLQITVVGFRTRNGLICCLAIDRRGLFCFPLPWPAVAKASGPLLPSHPPAFRVRASVQARSSATVTPSRRLLSCTTRGALPLARSRRPVSFERLFDLSQSPHGMMARSSRVSASNCARMCAVVLLLIDRQPSLRARAKTPARPGWAVGKLRNS